MWHAIRCCWPSIAREWGRACSSRTLDACRAMGFARRCAVATVLLDAEAWAEQQFAACLLDDKRRTKRLVSFAAQSAHRPDASTPEQSENWTDCKAAYRLFDQTDVTFEAVTAPH